MSEKQGTNGGAGSRFGERDALNSAIERALLRFAERVKVTTPAPEALKLRLFYEEDTDTLTVNIGATEVKIVERLWEDGDVTINYSGEYELAGYQLRNFAKCAYDKYEDVRLPLDRAAPGARGVTLSYFPGNGGDSLYVKIREGEPVSNADHEGRIGVVCRYDAQGRLVEYILEGFSLGFPAKRKAPRELDV